MISPMINQSKQENKQIRTVPHLISVLW